MDKSRKASLKTIAKTVGCSTTTVSNVINRKGLFGDAVRDKILAAIKKYNYTINASARTLRMGKSETVAVVFYRPNVDIFKSEYYLTMMYGLQKRLSELGFEILLSEVSDADAENNATPRFVARGKADAIVVLGRVPENVVRLLGDCRLPMLMLDSYSKGFDSIYTDGVAATKKMVSLLAKSGHRKIAYFAYDNFDFNTDERIRGFLEGAKDAGISKYCRVVRNFVSNEGGTAEFEKIASTNNAPTAVLASNDVLATSLMMRARQLGLEVPSDVSFCGYDDTVVAARCEPPLTTAHVDCERIGAFGADTIAARIKSPNARAKTKIFSAEIIERESASHTRRK